jgi:hypothetical protein
MDRSTIATSARSGADTATRFELPAIGLWTSALDVLPMARARDMAAELECLGYGALWIPEVAAGIRSSTSRCCSPRPSG